MDREGILKICKVTNVAQPGFMPREGLVELCSAYYIKRTVGYGRLYAALGANQSINMLVRCFNVEVPDYTQELYVVFEDDTQFRVAQIQEIVEEGAIDLTLERLEEYYDLG